MITRNRIQFECPDLLDQRLRAYSEQTGLGVSEVIRAAISDYLDRKATTASRRFHVQGQSGTSGYSISGVDLVDAIRSNISRLAHSVNAGSVAGWRIHSLRAEYRNGILGGKGGAVLTLTASGLPDAFGRTTNAKNHEIWIEAKPEDLPQPWSLSDESTNA